jgi:hypothetical protein
MRLLLLVHGLLVTQDTLLPLAPCAAQLPQKEYLQAS